MVVVATDDAVLVSTRENGEGLRRVVRQLEAVGLAVTKDHLKVHRPWGSYQSLGLGERYQVKRIVVKRGGRLSLQLHIIAQSIGSIADKVQMVHENESVYLPIGSKHRLENPGEIDLKLIEVQTGNRQLCRR